MKNCTDCKHANWARTASGKLHPSGDGRCMYPYKVPPFPASMHWSGYINRREELPDHCVYFSRDENAGAPLSARAK